MHASVGRGGLVVLFLRDTLYRKCDQKQETGSYSQERVHTFFERHCGQGNGKTFVLSRYPSTKTCDKQKKSYRITQSDRWLVYHSPNWRFETDKNRT